MMRRALRRHVKLSLFHNNYLIGIVLGAEHFRRNVAVKDAQIMLKKEERARGMG